MEEGRNQRLTATWDWPLRKEVKLLIKRQGPTTSDGSINSFYGFPVLKHTKYVISKNILKL